MGNSCCFNGKIPEGLQVDSVLRTRTGQLQEHFDLSHKLGHGQYGTIYFCVDKKTGKNYACKSIAKRKLLSVDDVDGVRREIEIMHHLSGHPNVIEIKGAYEDAVAVHMVMELCRGGVMHRDLKPENFLFVNDDEGSPMKTIDFGLSVFFKPGEIFSDAVGTPYYVAPEVLRKRYGPEADVWSGGVIVYILLSGVPPFWAENKHETYEKVSRGNIDFSSDPWPNISAAAKDLVKKMLERDPRRRLTAHQVLCHPWLQTEGVLAPDKPLDSAVLSRLMQFSTMNMLKKMALRVIAESQSSEEVAGLREMFKTIDTDNSGYLTFDKLEAGLNRFGANLSESEIHDLMKAADVDNNGTIEYGEFLAATLHPNKIAKDENLLKAFSYFDRNRNGYITRDKLERACQEFRIEDPRLEEMIQEADLNNDGGIDYNEFVAMLHRANTHRF